MLGHSSVDLLWELIWSQLDGFRFSRLSSGKNCGVT